MTSAMPIAAAASHVPTAATAMSAATSATADKTRGPAATAATHMAAAAASTATATATTDETRRLREAWGCHGERRRERDYRSRQYRFVILHIRNSICPEFSNSIDTLLRQFNVAIPPRFRNAGYGFVMTNGRWAGKMRPNRAVLPRPCWTSGRRDAINPSIFRDGFRQ
jgi:hypothetical protein